MSVRSRRASRRTALREAVLELFATFGLLLGLYTALPLLHADPSRRCRDADASQVFGVCLQEQLWPIVLHVGLFAAGGAVLGLATSLLLLPVRGD